MARINRRKLKESDVTFTIEVEPEDMPVRGHFMSGDPEYEKADRELEDSIIEASEGGSLEAWCCLVVTAGWTDGAGKEYYGRDTLGGCSFLSGIHESTKSQIASCVDDHGMRAEALADLQRAIDHNDRKEAGQLVLEATGAIPEKTLKLWAERGITVLARFAKAELARRRIKG